VPRVAPVITASVQSAARAPSPSRSFGSPQPRELTQARPDHTATGANVQTTSFERFRCRPFFATWYQSTQSTRFGGQFLLTEPFTVSGDQNAITNVSVTLTNTQGTRSRRAPPCSRMHTALDLLCIDSEATGGRGLPSTCSVSRQIRSWRG